jgi:DNA-directed RNA polymerase subunit beta
LDLRTLTDSDIKETIKRLIEIKDGRDATDDIDHLGNRRVRSVGELVENQFRIGILRIQKSIIERMASIDADIIMPHDLINSKLLVSAIKEFFGTSQLSQFMDQTNPLSEITHKRRLSALGPGGVNRERAGLEVRDVHPTHYGRICPIETPEGQNIGLINSLTTYARINQYGFIETPYRKVVNGIATDEILYLSALDEAKYKIAQATIELDANGKIIEDAVNCRLDGGNFVMLPPADVDFMDVNPMQVVSVAASMIPFLENNDANRALMGSNMQRQAVPLMKTQAPFVGTGVEAIVSKDSGTSILALNDGIVEYVDSTRIVVRVDSSHKSSKVDIYNLLKFRRSNHNTCINQIPIVSVGDKVKKHQVIVDGPSSDKGELALGKNVLVAYLPWKGYTFEDSIVISERVVRDDLYTSIHIEEFEIVARDTRLGAEEITRDIPNVSEETLNNIDEVGIVNIGAEINPGDILVGKVTPKSESLVTPEEKLLRAIFGEKASDVRDSSLYVPPGVSGTVIEVRVLSRRGVAKDQRSLTIERAQVEKYTKDHDDELDVIEDLTYERLRRLLLGQTIISGSKHVSKGLVINEDVLKSLSKGLFWQIIVESSEIMEEITALKNEYEAAKARLTKTLSNKVEKLQAGDDLPQGALKVVKVFVAIKHKLQPGDKMSGRHGNKGIISQILGRQDMPYLPDGKPIDLILNPLGVPSRMNVGQLFEGLFGFAADNLDKRFKILPFDEMFEVEASRILISSSLKSARNYSKNSWLYNHYTPGKIFLKDGRTGEYFDNPITVCKSYILKLIHLVDDKIHARATGPYSLITQQPLGGKSQQGGQRFGEMEVWALEAFGAAYTLQELLTIKSDDINGRNETLSAIIRGERIPTPGIPESFKVLILELRALGLDIGMYKIGKDKKNETNEIEINILENSKENDRIPNYKSLEIL